MPILRIEHSTKYTLISNEFLQNPNISLKAKGLLCYMLSCKDDWKFSIEGLAANNKDGISSITTALNELEELGYHKKEIIREDGKIKEWVYYISEEPVYISPDCEKPHLDFPHQENRVYNNKQLNNKQTIKKENKKKENFTPPTLEEVREYAKTTCTNVDAEYFYNFFSTGDWHDSNGKQVKNWKQKMITWNNYNNKSYSKTTKVYKDNIPEHTKSEDEMYTEKYLQEFESYAISERPDYKEWVKEQKSKDFGGLLDV